MSEYQDDLTARVLRMAWWIKWVLRAPPQHLFYVYIGIIFLFAGVFFIFRRDFYHSYVKNEPAVIRDKIDLAFALCKAFEDEFSGNSDFGDGVTFKAVLGPVRIKGEQDDKLLGAANVMVVRWRRGLPQGPSGPATIIGFSTPANAPFGCASTISFLHHEIGHDSIHFQSIPLIVAPRGDIGGRIDERGAPVSLDMTVDAERRAEETNLLGNDPEDVAAALRATKSAVERLRLKSELRQKVDNYVQAEQGFPHSATGTIFRMLYLSLITITTVGYGDIVPLSDVTRLLVGLEATCGIVLLGLLVNSFNKLADRLKEAEKKCGPG